MDLTREERDAFRVDADGIILAVANALGLNIEDYDLRQTGRALTDVTEVLIKLEDKGRPEVEEESRKLLSRVMLRQPAEACFDRATMKLQCMFDAAHLMGGPALRSFLRSLNTIDRFEAEIHVDTCMLSLTWKGGGFFGGFIFHGDCREWNIHT